jgi:type IV pilus assembly protein PilN
MIRVNLLVDAKKSKRGSAASTVATTGGAPTWLLAVLGALLVQLLVFFFVYNSKDNELKKVAQDNKVIQASIDGIKANIAKHAQIKDKLRELKEREEAIDKLQAARTGPTSAVMELSHIMSEGRGPSLDRDRLEQLKRDNPSAVPNPGWDPRRLWLIAYSEANREVKITGLARDGEDVSEFLRRISLSDYFMDVKLLPASKSIDAETKIELVKFQISARAKY